MLLYNALIINEGESFIGYVLTDGELISEVGHGVPRSELLTDSNCIDLEGKWLLPGIIDDQVHFREPGLTHKADIASESRAALAGGVTSFMDMPNCKPPTVDRQAWQWKMDRAAAVSAANYSFWIGATNDNMPELAEADFSRIPGIKVFLGASTGNMLVDDEKALDGIFSAKRIVAIHSEDEGIIRENMHRAVERFGEQDIPVTEHPNIRSREACVRSTEKAIERACRLGTRLHILHLSTAEEAQMLNRTPSMPAPAWKDKKITAEVCVHHLWFTADDYPRLGARIKWNPAVKDSSDREELRKAVNDGRIDVVATDHAPHLLSEKEGGCRKAASGGPLVQHSLLMMLEMASDGLWPKERVVSLMAHNPARLFGISRRGFIRPGYFSDLTVVNPDRPYTVNSSNLLTKCGWSPLEGHTFPASVETVIVNGSLAFTLASDGSNQFHAHPSHALLFHNAD